MTKPTLPVAVVVSLLLATACRRGATGAGQGAGPEEHTLDVTSWTQQTELFMEHPPFVAGQTIRFAVHLTRLADFQALNAGRPSIEMSPVSGGSAVVLPGSEPLRPGAFRVEGKLPPAGQYRWALLVNAPGLSDRHDLGTTTVFPDEPTAIADAEKRPEQDAAAIAYLKEQQWTNPFSTAVVREGDVRTSIRVPAAIEPVTGGDALVAAPADGRYASQQLPSVGDRVAAGQTLGRLEPRLSSGGEDRATLESTVAEAQAALDGAKADLARAERLLEERAVPGRRVEDARRAVAVADARVTAARARLAQRDEVPAKRGRHSIRECVRLACTNRRACGRSVRRPRCVVYGRHAALPDRPERRVELQAQVPPNEAVTARTLTAIAFEIPRTGRSHRAEAGSCARCRRD